MDCAELGVWACMCHLVSYASQGIRGEQKDQSQMRLKKFVKALKKWGNSFTSDRKTKFNYCSSYGVAREELRVTVKPVLDTNPPGSLTRHMFLLAVVGKRWDKGNHCSIQPGDSTRQDVASVIIAQVTTVVRLNIKRVFVCLWRENNSC